MSEVLRLAAAYALTDETILITGETGTGKDLLARHVHDCSARARLPFVVVNCAAIPASLLERELFGHARGAYTSAERDVSGLVETAMGGTLFLDEVGELPIEAQPKLLRFLEGGTYRRLGDPRERRSRVRLVAATNADLETLANKGQFRRDLLYRLRVLELTIPPLRERPEDVLPLLQHFLSRLAGSSARLGHYLSGAELRALRQQSWPGNVRELEQLARRMTAKRDAGVDPMRVCAEEACPTRDGSGLDSRVGRASIGRARLQAVLQACRGNRRRAAQELGVSRQTLYRWLRLSGLK